MCTYNGVRYLRQQLDSIAAQSELPRAMVVLDDGSTDGSWELLQSWAARAPFPVRVERNTERLGVVRNFERAISMLDQAIVFLSDQDDTWNRNKLATFVDRFVADPRLGLLHSDADLVDGGGKPLGRTLFATLLVTADERSYMANRVAYKVYAKRNLVTGAACAFRRSLFEQARPFSQHFLHDEWLGFVAAMQGSIDWIDAPTMQYRLHGANAVGVPIPSIGRKLRLIIESFAMPMAGRQRTRAERLEAVLAHMRTRDAQPEAVAYVSAAASHARFRSNLPRNPFVRMYGVARERAAGHYRAWSSGSASILRDLLLTR